MAITIAASEGSPAAAAAAHQGPREIRTANRAGYRRLTPDGRWTYHITPEAWRTEVCKGLDAMRVARLLHARGFLKKGEGKNLASRERIPGVGPIRVYVVLPAILEDGA